MADPTTACEHGPQRRKCPWCEIVELEAEVARLQTALENYGEHASACILSRWEAGEPRPDGSYWMKYAGRWYQAKPRKTLPRCRCGFAAAVNSHAGRGR